MLVFRPSSSRSRGFGLVELMVSSALLLIILVLVLAFQILGRKAWSKTSASQEVLGQAQRATRFLTEELQRSSMDSVSLSSGGESISFLTAKDENGQFTFSDRGSALWERWLIISFSEPILVKKSHSWTASLTQRETPLTIELGTGQPFSDFLSGDGEQLARNVESFQLSRPTGSQIVKYEISIRSERDLSRAVSFRGAVRPRN